MAGQPVDHKALFQQTPVTRFLIEQSGDEFVVVEASDRAKEFFAKPLEKIIGQPIDKLFNANNTIILF
ncbi:MAG: hypothetical protein R3D88_00840 [Alphaproteobacteria bacterium]